MRLMKDIRRAIEIDDLPNWIKDFMKIYYLKRESGACLEDSDHISSNDPGKKRKNGYPVWILNALDSLGIFLLSD